MIWHQILMNGQQNTLLTPIALMLSLVLVGVAVATIAIVTRAVVATAVRLLSARTVRLGPHFICSPELC